MTILVTGAGGFIGRTLVKALCQKHVVHALDVCEFTVPANVHKIKANLLELTDISAYSTVIHLAAVVKADDSKNINRKITEHLINLISSNKLIFASTVGVYGTSDTQRFSETDSYNPSNPYAISKTECEKMIIYSNINFTIARIANVYGPGESKDTVINRLLEKMKQAKDEITVLNGDSERDFIHVDDVSTAFLALHQMNLNGIYNVATGKSTTIKTVSNLIRKALKIDLKINFDNKTIDHSLIDPRKLAEHWSPKIELHAGISLI